MGNGGYRKFILIPLVYLFIEVLGLRSAALAPISTPLNCTDTSRLCASFLAFKPTPEQTLPVIMSMFDVLQDDISYEGNGENYVFIRKNCSCSWGGSKYLTNTTLTVKQEDGSLYDLVMNSYHGLAYLPHKFRRGTKKGAVVSLRLMCGCSNGLWNYLMSYIMEDGDSVASLASRFGVSMSSIESVNNLPGPDNFTIGSLYYIPLDSVPGQRYPANDTLPGPAPSPSVDVILEPHENRKNHAPFWWIIGSLAFGFAMIVGILLYVFLRSSCYFRGSEGNHARDLNKRNLHKFHILRNASFCCGSGRRMCCSSQDMNHPKGESNNRQMNIPAVIRTDVFDVEKPLVFTFDEILSSTEGFSDSNLLGHGTYGSVHYAVLQDQEVAIKKMTVTKTKEFMAEMKVLCKVHHANLVELIGYAATPDELFLIYEYAQKGSLRHHLHEHQGKGHTSLSWIMRVQIALDAARGLEYIHEHTKPHYVHRDIKTSNILIDGSFRAKISDFGLAKLIMTTGEESVTRVVGTYGYLAPEYLRDGIATTKCDVYAFGVVLFELISGEEAISRRPERRSLTSIMIAAMKNSTDISSLKDHIDPNLLDLYPHDCLLKMAILARQCVDSDPVLRPNMKQVVISLSHILLSSIEWEATLAGNSQVFSGLVQGR